MGNGWGAIPCDKDREIDRVLAEFKDKEVIIDGENKKEHEYSVPNTKMNLYNDKNTFFNISNYTLNEFKI
jgi:hypothetical protein